VISCDTNILFPACDSKAPQHASSRAFLVEHAGNADFCLCEQVLMELYCLLRNPAVCRSPLSASDAVQVIQGFRSNPHWRIVDVVLGSDIMKQVWPVAAETGFAYRRIFDVRLAMTLRHNGVTELATRNKKDFDGLGFLRVWDPLVA
jgi:uncharacterized protein